MGTPKIKSATLLRSDLYDTLKNVAIGEPQIITHKQGEPVLLISKEAYDIIIDENMALKKMAIGLSEIESGMGIKHKDILKKFKIFKNKWK